MATSASNARLSLYVTKLNDKVRKNEMRRALYLLFSQFGKVLDVVVLKTPQNRGFGFVVFSDTNDSGRALSTVHQKQSLYGKILHCSYAREGSFAVDPSARVRREASRVEAKKQEVSKTVEEQRGKRNRGAENE